jgi:plasmid stabilization system protein ParE
VIDYRFLPAAEEEMVEAALFYEAAGSGLGHDFLGDVQRGVDLLRERPQLGRSMGRGLRQALLTRFPFSLIYALEPEAVLIVAVAHQRRRPGYWRTRRIR